MVIGFNTISSGGITDMKEKLKYLKEWKEWIGYWVIIFGIWGTSLYITLTFT